VSSAFGYGGGSFGIGSLIVGYRTTKYGLTYGEIAGPSDSQLQIGGLARKMRPVGLVAVILGVVELILGLLLLIYAFRDQLPADVLRRIPEDTLKQLPPPSQLWAVVLQAATSGLIFLLIGLWTRSAASPPTSGPSRRPTSSASPASI